MNSNAMSIHHRAKHLNISHHGLYLPSSDSIDTKIVKKKQKKERKIGSYNTFFNSLQQLFVPLTHHGNIIKQLLVDKMQKGPLIRSRVPLHFVPKKKKSR